MPDFDGDEMDDCGSNWSWRPSPYGDMRYTPVLTVKFESLTASQPGGAPICPITLEPIKVGGLTHFGNLYEYRAISDWLAGHDTDPITGEKLPTRYVTKLDMQDMTAERLETLRGAMRMLSNASPAK